MSYSELLKNPKWQRKRLEIMQRDDFKCQLCGDIDSTLNVHHKNYEKGKNPWEYENNELVTLCEDCHDEVETLKFKNIQFIDIYSIIRNPVKIDTSVKLIIICCKNLTIFKYRWDNGTTIAGIGLSDDEIPLAIESLNKSLSHE